jgi:hypothetical protein
VLAVLLELVAIQQVLVKQTEVTQFLAQSHQLVVGMVLLMVAMVALVVVV